MIGQLESHLNYLAIYSLLVSIFLLLKERKLIQGSYEAIGFLTCVILYLLIDNIRNNSLLHHFVIAGPSLVPFTFWLFTRAVFQDHSLNKPRLTVYMLGTLLFYYVLYFMKDLDAFDTMRSILGRTLSIFFIVLALIEAQTGKQSDLDEKRKLLRRYFTYVVGLISLITILSELGLRKEETIIPRIVQRSSILLVNSFFILTNFSVKGSLLSKRKKKTLLVHPEIIEKIQRAMKEDQLFKREKLSIGQLAEAIGEQEYRVRQVINQEMDYRNFIDFTNSFRIKEARDLLSDPSKEKLTILEIAYQTGFNSIGPFNRAFKVSTGMTPTQFRKMN